MDPSSCRVCLSTEMERADSLLSLSFDGQTYAELLAFICNTEIDLIDARLPQNVCSNCIVKIESASSLKRKFLETQDVLSRIFAPSIDVPAVTENEANDMIVESIEELNVELVEDIIVYSQPASPQKRPAFQRKQPRSTTSKNKKPELHDYQCFICNQMFDLISTKDLHVKQEHSDARVCRICDKRKLTPISLESHLRFHSNGYRFLCSGCGKSFRFKNLLDSHFKVEHADAVKFHCDMCTYETKFKINLERHFKSVHLKIKKFKCGHCANTEYSTQVGLNLHLYRLHNYPAPVTCAACLQGFTFDSELRVHKKHCTGNPSKAQKARPRDAQVDILENGFKCRVCEQVFSTRGKWSVHFHHKHKSANICHICQKQMASSTSLMKHIQVQHNNIKKFQCDVCSKTFGFKHSLESHKNTHTGDKPFACDMCSFRSGDRSTISKHRKKIHGHAK